MRLMLIDTAFLGDLILDTPLVRAAAERDDRGRIDVLTSPAGALALANHPQVGAIRIYRKRNVDSGPRGLWQVVRWVRCRGVDVALLPRRSLRSTLVSWLAGVPRRIGLRQGPGRWLLTDAVTHEPGWHQVDRNLSLLQPLGMSPVQSTPAATPLELFATAAEQQAAEVWLQDKGVAGEAGFVALAPGSAWATKRWPLEHFAELAARLAVDRPVVVVGAAGERALAESIREGAGSGHAGRIHDATGLSPAATAHLLRRAAAMVSNDSGSLHIGQAAGVPLVALFGPTTPEQGFAPRGDGHALLGVEGLPCRPCGRHGAARCPQVHWRCMRDLLPETVAAAVQRLCAPASEV